MPPDMSSPRSGRHRGLRCLSSDEPHARWACSTRAGGPSDASDGQAAGTQSVVPPPDDPRA